MSNHNSHQPPMSAEQKVARIAEGAHTEHQGRMFAIGYVCVLVLGWLALSFFNVPILSDIVHLLNNIACGLFDAATDHSTQTATYVKTIQNGHEVFVPVAQTKPEKGFSKLPLVIGFILLLYCVYQYRMADRAHGRWAFFGNHEH